MAEHYKISILLPTRGRTKTLQRSLESLITRANHINDLELRLGFDDDDNESLDYFSTVLQPWLDSTNIDYTAMLFKPMGYGRLNEYVNGLAANTNSDWFFFWNDDAVMQTQGWDSVIVGYTGQFKLLSFCTHNMHPYSIFPIVPRTWYDLLGYISPHPTQDGWVSQQAYMLDIYQRIDVDVLHDRFDLTGNNNDDIFNNRPMLEGKPNDPRDFHSKEMIDLRHVDCAKLAAHMRRQGISTEFFENIFKGTQDPWQRLAENDINSQMVQFANPHALNGVNTR